MISQKGAKIMENIKYIVENSNTRAVKSNMVTINGPSEEELNGFNIEDRKRRRSEPVNNELMVTDEIEPSQPDFAIYNTDCVVSSTKILATLTRQASHS